MENDLVHFNNSQSRAERTRNEGLSRGAKARKIAQTLKKAISKGDFMLSQPAELLPGTESGVRFHGLKMRSPEKQHLRK